MIEALAATGLLGQFQAAGVLAGADVHVARRLQRLGREDSEPVLLAAALAVRAVRLGSVCVELERMHEVLVEGSSADDVAALPWPAPDEVLAALRASPLVTGPVLGTLTPLRLVDDALLYLDRYHRQEQSVRDELRRRDESSPPFDAALLAAGLAELFPTPAPDRQRIAAALAVSRWTTIVAGGPGTGKTHTVARVLRLLQAQQPGLRVALAAPTGKAAARLQEQVQAQGLTGTAGTAVTLHRLLGWRPGSASRFLHDADDRLPYDVVVVDETSMVSLTMTARLVEALRPDTRLVLVGDPDQLASVDAGAVLGDLVARPLTGELDPALAALLAPDLEAPDDPQELALSPAERDRLRGGVVRLSRGRRYGGAVAELAVAVRRGDADAVLAVLGRGDPTVQLLAPDELEAVRADVTRSCLAAVAAAEAGDVAAALGALDRHRLLCAHRAGPYGEHDWERRAREWVERGLGRALDPVQGYPGQPLLVTANDHDQRVYNGDTGVVVRVGEDLRAAFAREGSTRLLPVSALPSARPAHAMTIHRAQGSQYSAVTVVLPDESSALLTRELLYTAVTRAQRRVRVIGTEQSVRAAVGRRVLRASGLRRP